MRASYVTEEDIAKAEESAKKTKGSIVDYLLNKKLINKDLLGQAVAESLKVPYADLNTNIPSKEQVLKIPEKTARELRAVLFEIEKDSVVIATDKPENARLGIVLKTLFGNKKISVAYSLTEDIDNILVNYRQSLKTRFVKIIKGQNRVAPEIINEIIEDALVYKASDIHFEPQEKEIVVRFRVDGVLKEAGRIPKIHYENILNRIKVQSHLRIDEHFSAQDGSMRYLSKAKKPVDMRISLVPTLDGEKIVIRILASYMRVIRLDELGLTAENQKILQEVAQKPFGMILVTGPTGSGKTTSLYAVLKILNQSGVNITTIEDPVEYRMLGVNQIQVNPQTNLTFAKGLRSIVRQDPDIILVGEIRDNETAEIAVNAALTGHLLLSTFHANDAATAVPRLLDMGIEPFLMASTLEVVIAQRLIRKLCESCRYSITVSQEDLKKQVVDVSRYFKEKSITLYQGKGCKSCNNTGYKGRSGIFEFIKMTSEMKNLILQNPSTQQIWQLAKKQGSCSLFEDGLEKVKNGLTTIEELLRVAVPEELSAVNLKKEKKDN